MNAICENCQKTFIPKQQVFKLLKKTIIIVAMVFGVYYFFTNTNQGKEYKKKIKAMMKNACPRCMEIMAENMKKVKDKMESIREEEKKHEREENNKNVKKK